MDKNKLIEFIAINAIVLIPLYFIFLIIFVWYTVKKVNQLSKLFNNTFSIAEGAAKFYTDDLKDIHKKSNNIKEKQSSILKDIKSIDSILKKYKGETMDTKIYNDLSAELAQHIEDTFISFPDEEKEEKKEYDITSISNVSYDKDEEINKYKIGQHKKSKIIETLKANIKRNLPVDNSVETVDKDKKVEIKEDIFNMDKPLILKELLKNKDKE